MMMCLRIVQLKWMVSLQIVHIPDWFDNQFRGLSDRYQHLMEYYVGLDAQPVCGLHVTALQIMNNWKEDPKEWELSVVHSPISFIDLTEE